MSIEIGNYGKYKKCKHESEFLVHSTVEEKEYHYPKCQRTRYTFGETD